MNAFLPSESDQQREQRIRELAAAMKVAKACNDGPTLRRLWGDLRDTVMARSPQQVQAMEQDMGVSHA